LNVCFRCASFRAFSNSVSLSSIGIGAGGGFQCLFFT
jgi:hypothetical protein